MATANGNGAFGILRTLGALVAMVAVAGAAIWTVAFHVGNADIHQPNVAAQLSALSVRVANLERQNARIEGKVDALLEHADK